MSQQPNSSNLAEKLTLACKGEVLYDILLQDLAELAHKLGTTVVDLVTVAISCGLIKEQHPKDTDPEYYVCVYDYDWTL